MSLFRDVPVKWGDEEFIIPANRVMGAIAVIEEVLTLDELGSMAQRKSASLAKLSMAYGNLLRYAGKKIDDSEVYSAIFENDGQAVVMIAIAGLCELMIPDNVRKQVPQAVKGAPVGNVDPIVANMSKKRTRQRSGKGG